MGAKWSFRKELKIGAALIALSLLIAFTEKERGGVVCQQVVVKMKNVHDNYYLDDKDVLQLVESTSQELKGAPMGRIKFGEIEAKIQYDKHVRNAELYSDLKGNLVVQVELRRPIARIVRDDGPDAYVSEEGVLMGVSEKFASRVVLISGAYMPRLMEPGDLNKSEEGRQLMEMINYIREEPFWNAQIAQIDINSKGELTLYPQVTGQLVEFGKPERFEEKLERLMVFYKEILPQKGWTKYERVNLKYEGQVIAE